MKWTAGVEFLYVELDMGNRIRRHSDPFQCRITITVDDWLEAYRVHGGGEIWLDLGCGKGEMLANLAERHPGIFFMGMDVRKKIAERFFPRYRHLPNLLLLHGNVNTSIPAMMDRWKVQRVFIHFPDPYDHKRRYRKRQMVDESLVEVLCDILAPGGVISLKTDNRKLFEDMHSLVSRRLRPIPTSAVTPNGDTVLTEWEDECLKKSIPVYSRLYRLE
jgi:tRNA (guanine-N7-)-methyltransferase